MIDYAYKSQVLASGICEVQKIVSYSDYCFRYNKKNNYSVEEANALFLACVEHNGFDSWKEAEKINYATYKRVKRLSDKITDMLKSGNCLFLTLTFTNEVLASTSADTRKQYIRKFLKSLNTTYIANIDFGKENHREHYHAIVLIDKITSEQRKRYNELCGSLNFKKVRKTSEPKSLAKYVSKLTNHAIKETTKRNAIIYSR